VQLRQPQCVPHRIKQGDGSLDRVEIVLPTCRFHLDYVQSLVVVDVEHHRHSAIGLSLGVDRGLPDL